MSDQADALRRLVREQSSDDGEIATVAPPRRLPSPVPNARARSLLLTSGKGGVGTSNLALNLALALGELGRSVLLVDADLGLANLDLLCGLLPSRDLGDVLSGESSLSDVVIEGPLGVRFLPGAHAMRALPEALGGAAGLLSAGLAALERSAEFLLIDAGSGLNPGIVTLAAAADEVAVVTTPEPTAVADTHAAIARLRRVPGVRLRVIVNQARSLGEAREVLDRVSVTGREFLGASVIPMGHVRHDPRVGPSVRARSPFLLSAPHGPASRCVRRLARSWSAEVGRGASSRPGFLNALAARWALQLVGPLRKDQPIMSP